MSAELLVTLPLPTPVMTALAERYSLIATPERNLWGRAGLLEAIAGAEGVLCSLGTTLDPEVIAAGTRLRVISSISVGTDHIDLDAATRGRIPVGHTPGVLVDSTADLAVGLMLDVTRRIAESDRFIRNRGWQSGWSTGFFLGTDLSRATVGIVGLGAIGQAVATRVQAFGARVVAWNRTPRPMAGVEPVELDALFERADIVSIHAALTDETHHLVNSDRIAAMKPGGVLINTARGGLVDEAALIDALDAGHIRAGLDVFEQEPLPVDSPLLAMENAVLVPHLGSATELTRAAMLERALENLETGLAGQRLQWCANPSVYDIG